MAKKKKQKITNGIMSIDDFKNNYESNWSSGNTKATKNNVKKTTENTTDIAPIKTTVKKTITNDKGKKNSLSTSVTNKYSKNDKISNNTSIANNTPFTDKASTNKNATGTFQDKEKAIPVSTRTSSKADGHKTLIEKFGETKAGKSIDATMRTSSYLLNKGMSKGAEGIMDAPVMVASWITNLLGDEKKSKSMQDFVKEDKTEKATKLSQAGETKMKEAEKHTFIKRDNIAGAVVENVGQMIPTLLVGGVAGAGAKTGAYITTGLMAGGMGGEEALNEGANINQATAYAILNSATEIVTEWVTGGIPGVKGSASKISLDNLVAKGLGEESLEAMSKSVSHSLIKAGYRMAGEGGEEALAEMINPLLKNATYSQGEKIDWNNVLQSTIVGAVTGGILNAPATISDVKGAANGTNQQIIKNNNFVQTITNKRYEAELDKEENQNLSKKEQTELKETITNQVKEEIQNGTLTQDEMEQAIAPDEYQAYQETQNKKEELEEKITELQNKDYSTLKDTEYDKITNEISELQQQLDQLTNNEEKATRQALNEKMIGNVPEEFQKSYETIQNQQNMDNAIGTKEEVTNNLKSYLQDNDIKQPTIKNIDNFINEYSSKLNSELDTNQTKQIRNYINEYLREENQKVQTDKVSLVEETKDQLNQENPYIAIETDNDKINQLRKSATKYFDNSKKTQNFIDTIEKVITDKNYNVIFDDTITNNQGESVNAQIRALESKNIEIRINPNSDRAGEFLLTHEITHAIETKEMKKLVMDYASNNDEFKTALENLKEKYGTDDVSDEVLADISGQLFGNQEFINELSIKKPNIFKKIYNKIKELANKITGNSKESLFIKDLKNKWEKAYRKATLESAVNNLKNDVHYHVSQKISVDIDKVLTNIKERNPVKLRDYTPKILVNNGIEDLPMYENPSHIRKNILTTEEARNLGLTVMPKDHYHGLGKELYIEAINSLDNPRVIFKNNNKDYLVLTTLKDSNGNNIIVPIEIETSTNVNNIKIDTNRIKTVYGKKNLNDYIKRNINQNIFQKIYEQKKERGTGPIPAASSFSNSNIPQSNKKVKSDISTKYSMQENKNNTTKAEIKAEIKRLNSIIYEKNDVPQVAKEQLKQRVDELKEIKVGLMSEEERKESEQAKKYNGYIKKLKEINTDTVKTTDNNVKSTQNQSFTEKEINELRRIIDDEINAIEENGRIDYENSQWETEQLESNVFERLEKLLDRELTEEDYEQVDNVMNTFMKDGFYVSNNSFSLKEYSDVMYDKMEKVDMALADLGFEVNESRSIYAGLMPSRYYKKMI